jgi:hypothetical protein
VLIYLRSPSTAACPHDDARTDVVHSLPHVLQRQSCSTRPWSQHREPIGAAGPVALHLMQRVLSARLSSSRPSTVKKLCPRDRIVYFLMHPCYLMGERDFGVTAAAGTFRKLMMGTRRSPVDQWSCAVR